MSCSKVVSDESWKKSVYKVSKTCIFAKRSFFLVKRKVFAKMLFLSIFFLLNDLSFETFPALSSYSQREKIKKQGQSTRKSISVCNYIVEVDECGKNGKERQKIYHLKERFSLHKMGYS